MLDELLSGPHKADIVSTSYIIHLYTENIIL